MKSFWWFRKPKLAGMARPGLNDVRWDDLLFHEAVLVGWLGTRVAGRVRLEDLRDHVISYAPKIARFYPGRGGDGPDAVDRVMAKILDPLGLTELLSGLSRVELLSEFVVSGGELAYALSRQRLDREIEFLRNQGIEQLVCLTEEAHHFDVLGGAFQMHHLPIDDVGAPTVEQAEQLSGILEMSKGTGTAVYCMAGLGRTSIMLMAAHMLRGESFAKVYAEVMQNNPSFVLAGAQKKFIESLGRG